MILSRAFLFFCLLIVVSLFHVVSATLLLNNCSTELIQSINSTQIQDESNLFLHFATHVQAKYNLPKSLHTKFKELLPALFKKYQKKSSKLAEDKLIQQFQLTLFRTLVRRHYKLSNSDWKNWKSCITFSENQTSWKQLLEFFKILFSNLHQRRIKNLKYTTGTRMVIVGSGPHGLLNAMEAYASGVETIQIYEKRGEYYNRNVWFDIYPEPYSRGYELLHEFGFGHLTIEYEPQYISSSQKVITIRCNILQEFLIKVLQVLHIKIRYNMEYITYCEPLAGDYQLQEKSIALFIHNPLQLKIESPVKDRASLASRDEFWCRRQVLREKMPQQEFYTIPFDILIGADGSQSAVRSSVDGMKFEVLHAFDISLEKSGKPHQIVLPQMHQIALLINLKPTFWNSTSNQWECPEVATDPNTGQKVDPWVPTFEVPGVISIFKRFYHSHCHCQILFHDSVGTVLYEKYLKSRNMTSEEIMQDAQQQSIVFSATSPQTNVNSTNSQNITGTVPLAWEEEAYPWELISKTLNAVLKDKIENITSLKQMIQQMDDSSLTLKKDQFYDMTFLKIEIGRVNKHGFSLVYPKLSDSSLLETANLPKWQNKNVGIILINGDASLSSYFRLGIGVNNAFQAYGELYTLITTVMDQQSGNLKVSKLFDVKKHKENLIGLYPKDLELPFFKALDTRQQRSITRIDKLVNLQLSTIFFETYCDHLVVFEWQGDELFRQAVYEKNYEGKYFFINEETNLKNQIDACVKKIPNAKRIGPVISAAQ